MHLQEPGVALKTGAGAQVRHGRVAHAAHDSPHHIHPVERNGSVRVEREVGGTEAQLLAAMGTSHHPRPERDGPPEKNAGFRHASLRQELPDAGAADRCAIHRKRLDNMQPIPEGLRKVLQASHVHRAPAPQAKIPADPQFPHAQALHEGAHKVLPVHVSHGTVEAQHHEQIDPGLGEKRVPLLTRGQVLGRALRVQDRPRVRVEREYGAQPARFARTADQFPEQVTVPEVHAVE